MTSPPRATPRKLLFALTPLACLLLLAECVALRVSFDAQRSERTALGWWLDERASVRAVRSAEDVLAGFGSDGSRALYRELYGPAFEELLSSYEEQYRAAFLELHEQIVDAQIRLLVLYVPTPFEDDVARMVDERSRTFFEQLCEEVGVELLDVGPALAQYSPSEVSLLPDDSHLSRLGHRVVAGELAESLAATVRHRAPHRGTEGGSPRGDLRVDRSEHHGDGPLAYAWRTNADGFRATRPLEPRSESGRQRVLLLGDSITFGLFVPEQHTFAAQLERLQPELETINAGVIGYSITQQLELFSERARRTMPDVVVLQVYFNDIFGMSAWERRTYLPPRLSAWARWQKARTIEASAEEERLFETLRADAR